jgi:superfamily II DNA or RNA helicase
MKRAAAAVQSRRTPIEKLRERIQFDVKCRNSATNTKFAWRQAETVPQLRQYQKDAIAATLRAPNRSLTIVMPCGSGKTLAAIGLVIEECAEFSDCLLDGCLLVVAHGNNSAMQWVKTFLEYTTLEAHQICLVNDVDKTFYSKAKTRVVIGTLQMLTRRSPNEIVRMLQRAQFKRCILDECHTVPTDQFGEILKWQCSTWSALTASPLRADGAFGRLRDVVGEEYSPERWSTLERGGFIAPMRIALVECPLPASWEVAWTHALEQKDTSLCERIELYNPSKLVFLEQLLRHWGWGKVDQTDAPTTLIFVDTLELLGLVASRFHIPALSGVTPFEERESMYEQLRNQEKKFVVVSRCGDVGVDLPPVKRMVQLDALEGSQCQFVQRAGRAFRPHECKQNGERAEFFDVYTALPTLTRRAWHRSAFLREQGFLTARIEGRPAMGNEQFVAAALCDGMLRSITSYQSRKEQVAAERLAIQNKMDKRNIDARRANARLRRSTSDLFKRRLKQTAKDAGNRRMETKYELLATEVSVLLEDLDGVRSDVHDACGSHTTPSFGDDVAVSSESEQHADPRYS